MKQKTVGVYEIGYEYVRILLRPGTGGEFYSMPENSIPEIKIGADEGEWRKVLEAIFHETFEFLLFRAFCRFAPTGTLTRDHSNYLFSFSHTQFSDICCKAAECLEKAMPDISREWRKWNKGKA